MKKVVSKNSESCIPPCAQLQVLSSRVDDLMELKSDVKVILQKTTDIEVHLAKVPLFSDLAPLQSRVAELEKVKAEAKAGWKVATVSASVVGGIITAGYYLVTVLKDFAHPK